MEVAAMIVEYENIGEWKLIKFNCLIAGLPKARSISLLLGKNLYKQLLRQSIVEIGPNIVDSIFIILK